MSFAWRGRWKDEYELAVKKNSLTRTIVPARKRDLSTWKGYLKTRDGQLHSMEVRLEFRARDGRTLFYPLVALVRLLIRLVSTPLSYACVGLFGGYRNVTGASSGSRHETIDR